MSPWRSLLLDLAAIAIFAAIGRTSHAEGLSLTGVLITAGPFWVGCLVGTLICHLRHLAYWPSAIVIWLSTVIVGMILRVLTGPGTQLSFTIVATITLGLLLLGWRAVGARIGRTAPTQGAESGPGVPNGEVRRAGE